MTESEIEGEEVSTTVSTTRESEEIEAKFFFSESIEDRATPLGNISLFLSSAKGPSNYMSCCSCSEHFHLFTSGVHFWFKSDRRPRTSPSLDYLMDGCDRPRHLTINFNVLTHNLGAKLIKKSFCTMSVFSILFGCHENDIYRIRSLVYFATSFSNNQRQE